MICFVILHYQAIEETEKCINSICKNSLEQDRIIIVDNASPNKSGMILIDKYKENNRIEVILNKDNLGFAKGNNIGYKAAKKYNPDYIVVMNNDVFIIQTDFSERVEKAFQKHRFDILGPDIYSTKINAHQNPQREKNYTLKQLKSIRKKLRFKNKHLWLLKLKYLLFHREKNVSSNLFFQRNVKEGMVLHGACYIFSKSFIEKHNNCFYNGTFMYFESYILHYLAIREGMKVIYEPCIRVLHHEDVATDQTYRKKYDKAVFVNKCLLDSCELFIDLMNHASSK